MARQFRLGLQSLRIVSYLPRFLRSTRSAYNLDLFPRHDAFTSSKTHRSENANEILSSVESHLAEARMYTWTKTEADLRPAAILCVKSLDALSTRPGEVLPYAN